MAIKGPETNNNGNAFNYETSQQQAAAAAPAYQTTQNVQSAPQAPGAAQFGYTPGLAPIQFRLNGSSQKVQDTLAAFQALIEPVQAQLRDFDLKFLPVESQAFGLRYSGIVVTGQANVGGKMLTVHQTLLLTSTGPEPEPVTLNVMNGSRKVVRHRVAAEAYDARYIAAVNTVLGRELKSDQVIDLGAVTLPTYFDEKSATLIGSTLTATLTAIQVTIRQNHPDFVDLTMEGINKQGRTEAKTIFSSSNVVDPVGAPMRSDVYVATTSSPQNTQQAPGTESINGPENISQVITRTYAYFEALWVGYEQPANTGWGSQAATGDVKAPFSACAVVTHMECPQAETIPGFLMGLIPLVRLSENNTWYGSYYQRMREIQQGQLAGPRSNVGALAVEAGQVYENGVPVIREGEGEVVDLNESDMTPEMFKRFMDRMFRPGLLVAVDCQISGPDSWRTDLLLEVGRGDLSSERAWIAGADVLTGGVFSQYWQEMKNTNANLTATSNTLIHMGDYLDATGTRRDIRDVGHVEVASFFERNNVRQTEAWCNTFLATPDQTMEEALDFRLQVLQSILTGCDMKVTGIAERVTLSAAFIRCLDAAVNQCGLRMDMSVPSPLAGVRTERGVANFVNTASLGTYVSSTFNRTSGGYGAGAMGGQGRGYVRNF